MRSPRTPSSSVVLATDQDTHTLCASCTLTLPLGAPLYQGHEPERGEGKLWTGPAFETSWFATSCEPERVKGKCRIGPTFENLEISRSEALVDICTPTTRKLLQGSLSARAFAKMRALTAQLHLRYPHSRRVCPYALSRALLPAHTFALCAPLVLSRPAPPPCSLSQDKMASAHRKGVLLSLAPASPRAEWGFKPRPL